MSGSYRGRRKETRPAETQDANAGRSKDSPSSRYWRIVHKFRDDIEALCAEVYLSRDIIETIRNNFFDGRPILFPDTANRLETTIDLAEMIVERYNDFAWDTWERTKGEAVKDRATGADEASPEGLVIDLAAGKDTAAIRQNVAFVVRMAKAAALANLDRNEEGWRLAREAYKNRPQDGENDGG